MTMFPGAGARVFYNEVGEPIGWDYPAYDDSADDYDPYEDDGPRWDFEENDDEEMED